MLVITGCAGSLPEAPKELPSRLRVTQPVPQPPPKPPTQPVVQPPPQAITEPAPQVIPEPPEDVALPKIPAPVVEPVLPPLPQPVAQVTLERTPAPDAASLPPPLPESIPTPAPAPLASVNTTPVPVRNLGPGELEYDVLHKANFNPFDINTGKSFRALQTLRIYQSELARHSLESTRPVDFDTSQVLVSSAGEKPTSGHSIAVTKMELTEDQVIVTVVQTIPGPNCVTTEGKSYPFEFVLVPSKKPIQIFERQKVDNC